MYACVCVCWGCEKRFDKKIQNFIIFFLVFRLYKNSFLQFCIKCSYSLKGYARSLPSAIFFLWTIIFSIAGLSKNAFQKIQPWTYLIPCRNTCPIYLRAKPTYFKLIKYSIIYSLSIPTTLLLPLRICR